MRQQEEGNYEAAAAAFRALLDSDISPPEKREALLRLGRCELLAGAHARAADSLARFVATYAEDPAAPDALFWLGQAREGLEDWPGAAEAYRRCLERRPLLAGYIQERIATVLARAGDHAGAAAAYRLAADAHEAAANKVRNLEGLARSLRALRRHDQAVSAYDEILRLARIAGYRALILFEAGATLRDAGRKQDAAARWNELVIAHPTTAQAAQAQPVLEQWGLSLAGPVTRARVEHAAGRHTAALAILQRYIQDDPQGHTGDAHFYAALCYRALGRHADAVREFDLLIQTHPQDALVVEGWYERGQTLVLAGAIDDAVGTFRELASTFPQDPWAPRALWRVAEVYERAGRGANAAAAYGQAAAAYPAATNAADARFRAGFVHFVDGRLAEAVRAWSEHLPRETNSAMRARLLLWLGKAAARLDDTAGARSRWDQAVAASPAGFWGLRARDLLAGRPFTGRAPEGAFDDPARYVSRGAPSEAERWLATWAGSPAGGRGTGALPATLSEMPDFQRGMALWALGDAPATQAELRQVRTAYRDDAHALYALALYARDRGLYQVSILAAHRVIALAPAEARRATPRLIEELAYPTYYADLVLREAQAANLDPLLFFALIFQESVFDRDATSSADARGLAQVIPSTGTYIAGRLGDSPFSPVMLWRPAVSVRYGVWYLSNGLRMFGDNALMALVGYNAGRSNAQFWAREAGGDDDVFFERVSNWQPRTYMIKIYELRARYEALYR